MISFLLLTCLLRTANAQTLDDVLMQPLNDRVRALKEQKPESYTFLSRTAFDRNKGMRSRWRAVTTMGRLDSEFFRADLEKALNGKEWFMRNAALIALQTTEDRVWAVDWSVKLLNDTALVVRTQAVRNLVSLDAREAVGTLWRQIFASRNFRGKQSLWVRVHMAEALARFAVPGQTALFQRLLMDPDERLHKWAMIGLEKSTGLKMGDNHVPLEIRRQEWLERLGGAQI